MPQGYHCKFGKVCLESKHNGPGSTCSAGAVWLFGKYTRRKVVCETLLSYVWYGFASQAFGSRFRGNDSD